MLRAGVVLLFVLFPKILWAQAVSDDDLAVHPQAVVAADHSAASRAGREVLRRGGNVVDAAVATSFALSVVRPASSGLGGGGFLMYWNAAQQRMHVYDYRERAPAGATRGMFAAGNEEGAEPASVRGGLAVAVPGEVAGLCRLHADHGRLPLADVLAPAIALARDGVEVDAHEREIQIEVLDDFQRHPEYRNSYSALWRLYLNSGRPWEPGARFHSPLPACLERIARDGAAGFHQGEVASAIVAAVTDSKGILTLDDLRSQQPAIRTALERDFAGGRMYAMPPPSSGGVAMFETLNVLEELERRHGVQQNLQSADFVHWLAESFQHAFADRAAFLGDADFESIPVERLCSPRYAKVLADGVSADQTRGSEAYGRQVVPDDSGTTHFSIVDAAGNAVACTETINTLFGSYVVEPRFGIVLNNEMDDFTARPGEPNAFGLTQSAANAVAAGKKPLSSMSPTIVVRDGKAQYVVGGSGGPRIISATLQVLLGMSRLGLTPGEAVAAPRLHHQWQPRRLELEPGYPAELQDQLERRGHVVTRRGEGAVVQAASRTAGGVRGASDSRKHGQSAGY